MKETIKVEAKLTAEGWVIVLGDVPAQLAKTLCAIVNDSLERAVQIRARLDMMGWRKDGDSDG